MYLNPIVNRDAGDLQINTDNNLECHNCTEAEETGKLEESCRQHGRE